MKNETEKIEKTEAEIPGGQRICRLNLQNILGGDADINPSLFYGKFAERDRVPGEESDEKKTKHVNRLISLGGWPDKLEELAAYLHSGAKTFTMQTETKLLIGRGTPSVFEQGISLHPLFGLPFLPGSAIKGVTAHWAAANVEDAELREQIFGPPTENEEKAQGKVVFLDAVVLLGKGRYGSALFRVLQRQC
ncbi:type III-B CRISPR module RAMP protein Cmr6 [Candidatus Electronema sp. TJ]|uniref:type III-B CRISPR module RAMP protein Cmr6 n=1 Tax=Candidatus Electronema sp. TJ TaxID=3401573 RepID=UPI003AA8DD71